jgi:hypothetical protein
MWPKYIVKDNFLNEEHFNLIKNISFDTKQDEWDIYKHKIYNDGKIEIDFLSSSNKKGISPLSEENIKNISDTYHDYMINCLKELAPEKLQHYWYTELNVVNNGKDYLFPIHSDSRDKLLSVVIYISPEKNEGTWLYEDKNGKNAKQVDWKTNRAFIFSRTDNTWHSYKADGINNRLALVYNLRSDKYWKNNV